MDANHRASNGERSERAVAGILVEPQFHVTVENWTLPPGNRWGFRNVRRIVPTAEIRRGNAPTLRLAQHPQTLGDIRFDAFDGNRCTVRSLLDRSVTDGMLILHHGHIVYEELRDGFTSDCQHIAFSMTKSLVGMLAGIFIKQGQFGRQDKVAGIIPELNGSGWDGSTVGEILDMTTAANFVEDYEDHNASVWALRRILYRLPDDAGATAIRSVRDYLPTVRLSGHHGDHFTYKSADTLVLAWIVERTTSRELPELIETEIWSKLGADRDAYIMLDANGVAYAAGGLCATLRDLGRFGLMVADGGALNGRQIVPEEWIEQCRTGDKLAFRKSILAERFPNGAYKNQWWLKDADLGIQLALGIHGQMIYIDRVNHFVGVKLSSWPAARQPETLGDTVSAFEAIAATL